jgi:peptide/nickel transport system permease protein
MRDLAILRFVLRLSLTALCTGFLAFVALRTLLPPPNNSVLARHASVLERDAYLDAIGYHRAQLPAFLDLARSYLKGNFGASWVTQEAIAPLLAQRLQTSLLLMLPGILLAHSFGLYFGLRQRFSGPARIGAQASAAAGLLLCAVLMQWLLCAPQALGLFPVFGLDSNSAAGYFQSVAAPSAALALAIFGTVFPFYRALGTSPVRVQAEIAARALGISGWALKWQSVRPILGTAAAKVCFELPAQIVGGSLVIELVFAVPGMGRRGFEAAQSNDVPVLVAIAVLSSLLICLSIGLGDVLLRWLDPRLRAASMGATR